MWENEAAAARFGIKMLVVCADRRDADRCLRDIVQENPDMRCYLQSNIARVPGSDGLVHFVHSDNQVIGMEYHEVSGNGFKPSALMASRVRLSN